VSETTFVLGEPQFGRYTRPEGEAADAVVEAREALDTVTDLGDDDATLEATIDLANALTTARREEEAAALLGPVVAEARRTDAPVDALGWALLMLATAEQYLGRAEAATAGFEEAIAIAREVGDEELEHYALHHHGRHLVDQGDLDRARTAFADSLAIRARHDDPRAAQTETALAALG
jgi:tetratricopeptide (TPR) repeat protein